jgi:acyl-ACP thioesterase
MAVDGAWIIRRATMTVERLPKVTEELELVTWCSGVAKTVAERRTTIRAGGRSIAEAEAIWVHVDPEARRPARLPELFFEVYGESAGDRRPRTSLRHPATPPADAEQLPWFFSQADIDLAGHVNNTLYWRVAEEYLDLSVLERGRALFEAEFRAGIGPGQAVIARAGSMLWVCAPDGTLAATISIESR